MYDGFFGFAKSLVDFDFEGDAMVERTGVVCLMAVLVSCDRIM